MFNKLYRCYREDFWKDSYKSKVVKLILSTIYHHRFNLTTLMDSQQASIDHLTILIKLKNKKIDALLKNYQSDNL